MMKTIWHATGDNDTNKSWTKKCKPTPTHPERNYNIFWPVRILPSILEKSGTN